MSGHVAQDPDNLALRWRGVRRQNRIPPLCVVLPQRKGIPIVDGAFHRTAHSPFEAGDGLHGESP